MSSVVHRLAALLIFPIAAEAAIVSNTGLARDAHFEVYAQAGTAEARAVLIEFERLRAYFLQQAGLGTGNRPAVRVIVFRSPEEYARYELRPAADAYYVGTESRDLIVIPGGRQGGLQIAAHEYAHLTLHANALPLPPWLNEGLSEFFSAVRLNEDETRSGAQVPPRARILRTRQWMPLQQLVLLPADSALREQRDAVDLFYSESWALADMLMVSPAYHPRWPELMNALSSGMPSDRALETVYGRSLDEIGSDLHTWVAKRRITPLALPDITLTDAEIEVSEIRPIGWRTVLADLLLASGKLKGAQAAYEELAWEAPGNPDFSAALATIALQKDDGSGARRYWEQALQQGLQDASACYRYAVLANDKGFPAADVEPALQRAIAVQPGFDDAHYMLGLMEGNAGRYESAVAQLRAVRVVARTRLYTYWTSLADAYNHLDRREDAKTAANHAREHAATDQERAHAAQLLEISQTDLTVQFAPDAGGTSRLVMTRIPHGQQNWNPFIEPGDRVQRAEGRLRRIDCEGRTTSMTVETSAGAVVLTIADPSRVQMLNAPQEFICGAQQGNPVAVTYAARELSGKSQGVVRAVEFK